MKKSMYLLSLILFLSVISCKNDNTEEDFPMEVSTHEPTGITVNSVQIRIELIGNNILSLGVCYGLTPHPTVDDNKVEVGANTESTVYGQQIIFTTETILSTVTTAAVTEINAYSARSGGSINKTGGNVTSCGICWAEIPAPTIDQPAITIENPTQNTFVCNLTDLTPGTQYYVRAFSVNQAGIPDFSTRESEIRARLN